MFIRFDTTYKRDRQTHRQTPHDGKGRAAKLSDFDEILYTAADFELDERHVIKSEKSCIGHTPSSTERISCFFILPFAFNAPVGGFPSEYCHPVWYGKLEWWGYPTVKQS